MTIKTIINELKYEKIACFDLDYTLIKPKSGKKFPIDKNDHMWLYENVPEILKNYYNNNYTIVVFTNQKNIKNYDDFKYKLEQIQIKLNIPINYLVSIKNDKYRKPRIGMYEYLESIYPCKIDKTNSFYSGDACGRKTDFSDSDILFAYNIHLPFVVPEKIFKQNNHMEPIIKTNPLKDYVSDSEYEKNILEKINSYLHSKTCIINIGIQASGKSHFTHNLVNMCNIFNIVSNDDNKKFNTFEKLIASESYIIVDNTNPDIETRCKYLDLLKKNNYNIIYLWFNIPLHISNYLNEYRTQMTNKHIPNVAYNVYKKKFIEPSYEENVDVIIEINKVYGLRTSSHIFKYLY